MLCTLSKIYGPQSLKVGVSLLGRRYQIVGREGGRERGREGEREGERAGEREREEGREGGREKDVSVSLLPAARQRNSLVCRARSPEQVF